MREDIVMKRQQQGLAVPNSDSVMPVKPFISEKYYNQMNLKTLKRIKYFTKALLEPIAQGFGEEGVISCSNTAAAVEKLILWHKSPPTYREGGMVYM